MLTLGKPIVATTCPRRTPREEATGIATRLFAAIFSTAKSFCSSTRSTVAWLTPFSVTTEIGLNNGWSAGRNAEAIAINNAAAGAGAFLLQPGSGDCAVLLSLPPGAYTAQVSGVNGSTGVALVEVYQIP
jgi:hypothetical protein